ncbi:MAG: recombinase family protein [Clostridiales bacterium]|nr:recombinase family protein [Clostridiales bacterium]
MARQSKYSTVDTASQSQNWNAGLYIRLSREDGDKLESESISSQRAIIEQFISSHSDIKIHDYYIDDGWSGTDFDRPDFKRMFDDITAKHINCVIVKDLSRFGRNYVEAGKYLEVVFPMLNVRFIAVNDMIDSIDNPSSMNTMMVPIKNIMNDEYCRDISVKVRSSLDIRRKQGKFIGSFAAYGYKKDHVDRHKLVIDEEAAEIVRSIYDKFLSGYSMIGIARDLNAKGVLNPAEYKKSKGLNYKHAHKSQNCNLWCDTTVRRILTNEIYIGNLVQKKNEVVSYKVHICKSVEKNKNIRVEHTHEAIISEDVFYKVQSLLTRDTRVSPKESKLSVFAGFLKCADCGHAMQKKTITQPYKKYDYYVCSTFRKLDNNKCTKHAIRLDILEETVLAVLNKYIQIAVDFDRIIGEINKVSSCNNKSSRLLAVISSKNAEIKSTKKILQDLYPDYKAGLLSLESYMSLKEQYERKIESDEKTISELEAEVENYSSRIGENNEFIAKFKEHRGLTQLTREVLIELVDNIYIHEGGAIEIHLKCRNEFLAATEYVFNGIYNKESV